ncbi:MAG: two-component regulator propeller domain-containing protein [Steroidobacteraceae bacterium]
MSAIRTTSIRRLAGAVLLCAGLLPGLAGALPPMVFRHLGSEDGLLQSTVMSTAQDATGYIWLATEDGLYRHDGYALRRFGRERDDRNGLAGNFIWNVARDASGNLWLAIRNGGVARFDPRTERVTSFRHDPADARSLASDAVRQVMVASSGTSWIATTGGGLDALDPRSGAITHYRHDPAAPDSLSSDVVTAIAEDRGGVIWVGTDDGLNRLLTRNGRFRRYVQDPRAPRSLPSNRISALHVSHGGSLWIGTYDHGLVRFDGEEDGFTQYRSGGGPGALSNPDVRAILDDGSGRLWVGTADGLNLLDRVTGRFVRYGHDPTDPASLRDDYVMSLFQDRTGLLWVGTRAGGVSRWNPRSWAFGHLPTAVTHGAYSMAFEEDASGRLWVGTHGAGLLRVDPISSEVETAEQVFGQPRLLADRRVMALLRDRAGGLWIGTMGAGLVHVSARGIVRRYQHRDGDAGSLAADGVMALFQARDGRVWVGTYGGGVCIIDPLDGRVIRVAYDPRLDDALSSPRATAIAQGPDGTVWVGTDGGGLDALTERGAVLGVWRHDSRVPGSLAANTVYALHVDVRGRVWVGTDDGGLDRIVGSPRERGGVRFVNASTAEGLSSNTIYGIESGEDGALWLSGNQGLVRYDPDGGVVRRYHRENGLQREDFNFGAHHRLADGRLVFGGAGGFNLFDPASIGVQPVPPPAIVLTSVQVGGRAALSAAELNGLASLSLGYRDQALTLEFAALDYTAPQRNQYSYRLRGLGDAWTASGSRRFVNFTGLDAGDYVLEVRAAGPDGVWNSAAFALPISVATAPWRSPWALALYALAALLALGTWQAVQRRQLRLAAQRGARLEAEVTERTAELRQRNEELAQLARAKSDFLARMSHEIRTPMNGIVGMVQLLRRSRLDQRQERLAASLGSSAEALMNVLNDILDLSKAESGKLALEQAPFDLDDVLVETLDVFAEPAQAKGLEVVLAAPRNLDCLLAGDALRLRQVLMNLVGNAVKFTNAGEVCLGADGGAAPDGNVEVTIWVRDTGIGIAPEALEKVFEPFSQADESTTRRFGGTGLGLSICRELVELMGGTISVESRLGVGSTFTVRLRLARLPQLLQRSSLAGLQVRVVTRRRSLADAVQRLCQRWGAECLWDPAASDVLERRVAHGAGPRATIVDVEGSAANVAGLVQSSAARQVEAHWLLLGAPATTAALRDAPAAPGVTVVDKPLRPAGLHRLLASALAAGRPREPAVAAVADEAPGAAVPLAPPAVASAVAPAVAPTPAIAAGPAVPLAGHALESGVAPARAAATAAVRVLVAEDHPVNRFVIEGMLELLGCEYEIVESGREAVLRALAEPFDAILMDMNLPELDGRAATEQIRRVEGAARHTPIIAMTAHTDERNRQACFDAGMDEFMSKPLVIETLGEVLRRRVPRLASIATRRPQALPAASSGSISRDALARIESLERPGSHGLLDRVARTFVGKSTEQMASIRAALARGELRPVREECHLLRASSAYFGAERLSKVAARMEAACDAGDPAAVRELAAELYTAQEAAVAELQDAVARRSA